MFVIATRTVIELVSERRRRRCIVYEHRILKIHWAHLNDLVVASLSLPQIVVSARIRLLSSLIPMTVQLRSSSFLLLSTAFLVSIVTRFVARNNKSCVITGSNRT